MATSMSAQPAAIAEGEFVASSMESDTGFTATLPRAGPWTLAAAFGLTRLMAGLLYEVKPFDPSTYLAVALIPILTGLLASWIPALNAARIDPLTAIPYE